MNEGWRLFLDLASGAGGLVVILTGLLGFMFREKWKQLLQRSMAEHLHQMEHDFHKDLEAYKVSLIAEAERAKATSELRKSIALKYSEIEFERLVSLERVTASIASNVGANAMMDRDMRSPDQRLACYELISKLVARGEECEMFLPMEGQQHLLDFRQALLSVIDDHVGPDRQPLERSDEPIREIIRRSIAVNDYLRMRIAELGRI